MVENLLTKVSRGLGSDGLNDAHGTVCGDTSYVDYMISRQGDESYFLSMHCDRARNPKIERTGQYEAWMDSAEEFLEDLNSRAQGLGEAAFLRRTNDVSLHLTQDNSSIRVETVDVPIFDFYHYRVKSSENQTGHPDDIDESEYVLACHDDVRELFDVFGVNLSTQGQYYNTEGNLRRQGILGYEAISRRSDGCEHVFDLFQTRQDFDLVLLFNNLRPHLEKFPDFSMLHLGPYGLTFDEHSFNLGFGGTFNKDSMSTIEIANDAMWDYFMKHDGIKEPKLSIPEEAE